MNVNVIFLDFAKAFDKVPHRRLLAKLQSHGIDGKVVRWVASWLKGRKQRVCIDGSSSHWADVLSGLFRSRDQFSVLYCFDFH